MSTTARPRRTQAEPSLPSGRSQPLAAGRRDRGAVALTVGRVHVHARQPPRACRVADRIGLLSCSPPCRLVARRGAGGESSGDHTPVVQIGLRYGMALFIASEVMFFVAFFWAFFDAALSPKEAIGGMWPPEGIETFDPFALPLLNTLILLLSGSTVTWAHHALREGDRKGLIQGLALTVAARPAVHRLPGLRVLPRRRSASRTASIASTFFMATGFHGFHVIIGTIFLMVCLVPRRSRPLHAGPPFRLRGRGLVLALRRRGLAVPVRLRLIWGGIDAPHPAH